MARWLDMTMKEYCEYRKAFSALKTVRNRDSQIPLLAELAEAVKSNNPDKQIGASNRIRNILEIGPDPPFMRVIETGVMDCFVSFLDRHDFPQLQVEAANIFGLFAETTELRDIVFSNSLLVPKLVNLIRAPYKIIRRTVILTLGVIVKNSPELRESVLRHQAFESLIAQFGEEKSDSVLLIAAKALYYLCYGNPPLSIDRCRQVLPVLQQLLYSSNVDFIIAACWTLKLLSFRRMGYVSAAFGSAVCYKLIELMHHGSPSVMIGAIHTVSTNVVEDGNPLTQNLVDLGALPELKRVLLSPYNNDVIMAACKNLANISKCKYNQAFVTVGIIPALIQLFERSNIIEIKQEAALAVSNFTRYGTPPDIKSVSEHCIKPLCDMLDCSDNSLVLNCLQGLDNILHLWRLELMNNNDNFRNNIVMIEQVNGLQKIVNLMDPKAGPKNTTRTFATGMLINYWPRLASDLCFTSKSSREHNNNKS